jgi:hypothetical protein
MLSRIWENGVPSSARRISGRPDVAYSVFGATRAVRVRDEEPLFVHHEHTSTHLGCRLRDDLVEASRVVDVVPADLRGDPLCLEQGLCRELGRRAPLEVDGERDPERDDQDDQDVREREDESGSYLRGTS